MRKRVLSILLVLCLAFTLLPSTALASPSFVLTVGNTDVSELYEGNWDDTTVHYWKTAESGDDAYVETGSADDYLFSVSLDNSGDGLFTLTLNGVDITTMDSGRHGIFCNISLNIVLAGVSTNSVNSSGDAIYVSGNAGISGSGSLTVTAGTSSSGIYSPYSNIVIAGGTVTANGNTGISASAGSITISGGEVTAAGRQNGIWANTGVTISGGSVKVTATNTYGTSIYTHGSFSVTASPYKYRTNTTSAAPNANYMLYPGTAFVNSGGYRYVEIMPISDVYVSGDNANSGTVLVSGVIDSGNISYWLNDGSGSITSTGASAESYNVKYNEATQTLTLNGAEITSYHSDGKHQYGIYAESDLNIVLNGANVIGTTDVKVGTAGIRCRGDFSLSAASGGSLSIVSNEYGIDADDSVSIDGGAVSISAGRLGVTAGEGGFSLSDGEVSVTSEETGIEAGGDVSVTGAPTTLNVTACTATNNVGYGIVSSTSILVTDAAVIITKKGTRGDAAKARDDIRVSGSADLTIVDWSTSDGDDCGIHSNGSVAIGDSAQVDICSKRIGIYARESVYLGYVWNGSAYEASGSPAVRINSTDRVAAITPEKPDDFAIGINGIRANDVGISMAGGTLTAVGSQKALESSEMNLPSYYEYRTNTSQSAPESNYSLSTGAQFENGDNIRYVELLAAFAITKADTHNGSFTVSMDDSEAGCAAAGDTLILEANPQSGYTFSSWNVYKTGDAGIPVSVSGNSFTMPAYGVTVEASFTAQPPLSDDYSPPARTITVTETSSGLFRGAQGPVRAGADMTSAFSNSVEVKVRDTEENPSSFGLGISNTVYPFDISLYIKGTDTKTEPADGYAVIISLPIPDALLDVKEQLSIAHKADDGTVTALASQLKQINGIWYLVFEATEFSPYALVVNSKIAYDETAGLPYYLNSADAKVFIGFAANGYYIAPSGVTVLFMKNTKSFTDTGSHWAKNFIEFVTEREIFLGTGSGTFSPDTGMTRAMFATVIGRLYERSFGEIKISGDQAFTDCDYDDYYGKYVDWAAGNGILCGYGSGNFGPGDPVTREQMATILYRFAVSLGFLPSDMDTELTYPDANSISSWAQSAALYCQNTGIITGRDSGSFAPTETATRAEVAAIIQRFVGLTV